MGEEYGAYMFWAFAALDAESLTPVTSPVRKHRSVHAMALGFIRKHPFDPITTHHMRTKYASGRLACRERITLEYVIAHFGAHELQILLQISQAVEYF